MLKKRRTSGVKRIGVVNSGDGAGRAEETSRGKKTITGRHSGHADEVANVDGDDAGDQKEDGEEKNTKLP